MSKFIDLTGQKFGRLTVIKRGENYVSPKGTIRATWDCRCDCGNVTNVRSNDLRTGYVKSCGCYNSERIKEYSTTHGKSSTPFYHVWADMKRRCYSPECKDYKNYGGRGIKISSRWLTFQNFYNDMYESYAKHLKKYGKIDTTLDRKEVNKNYEFSNCKWSTQKEQANNKRTNNFVTFKGKTLTISEWSSVIGIKSNTLWGRINRYNWPVEKALTTPVKI